MNARRLMPPVLAALCALALSAAATPAFAAREYHPGVPPSFGSAGSGPGHFNSPSGVALNDATGLEPGAGDVYVLDREDNRVERFNAAGEYRGQFNGSGEFEVEGKKEKGAAAPTGRFSFTTSLGNGVAIDNSGKTKLEDPSVGDVYVVDDAHKVVDEFGALGEYEAQLTGTCEKVGSCPGKAIPFSKVYGVAVDPSGNLWVAYTEAATGESVYIGEFTDTGSFVEAFDTKESGGFYNALVVDASSVYFVGANRTVDKFDSQTGAKLAAFDQPRGGYGAAALAVAASTGDLFVVDYSSHFSEEDSEIEVYGPAGEVIESGKPYSAPLTEFPFKSQTELQEFTERRLTPSFEFHGLAVSPAGTVYASVRNASDVAIFEDVSLPEVESAAVQEAGPGEDSAALHGSFNPEGASVTACRFEEVSDEAFNQTRATEAEARGLAAEARGQAVEAGRRAAAARSKAEAFTLEGRKERAVEEEAAAKKEEELATAEDAKAKAEEAREQEQKGGWRTATPRECEPPAASIAGSSPVAVQTELTGLQQRAGYRVRLVAVAGGKTRSSSEFSLFTSTRPLVEAEASSAGSTQATVSAKIDPNGLPTTYRVEYGTAGVEEFSTPSVDGGTATAAVTVSVSLNGLQAGTAYRFRFIASNSLGATSGEEATFTTIAASVTTGPSESTCPNQTFSGFSAALADCRAYELVSNTEDDTYVPLYDENGSSVTGEVYGKEGNYRAAAGGDAITYMGAPQASGVGGNGQTGNFIGNHYLAVRGANGWEASDISIPLNSGYGYHFQSFSADLSVETFNTNSPEVKAEPEEPAECVSKQSSASFSRTATGVHALVTANQGEGNCYGESAGISADDSHILLQSASAYTLGAKPGAESGDDNLYDWVGGVLHQVNVLPDGEPEQQPHAEFGRKLRYEGNGDYSEVVSADGSRVFWTSLAGGVETLYVRENDTQPQSPVSGGRCTVSADACTVLVSEHAQFWTASSEGSAVFFTKSGDLYVFDVETEQATDLAPGGEVQGVIGASEDGSYVYFVGDGVLTGKNAEGKAPQAGQPNLYMSHGGQTTFIATLEGPGPNGEGGDNQIASAGGGEREVGDWQVDPGARTAEVAPGGRVMGFVSRLPLTGYDNYGVGRYQGGGPVYEHIPEVFVYEGGRIVCMSCGPAGAPIVPQSGKELSTSPFAGAYVATSGNASFMLRWINEREGAQAYFMTNQPLVASDTNGLQDVYEWESDGSGGCRQPPGCINLISTAEPSSSAYFVDASADGGEVFFTSRSQLVRGAYDETVKVYDARVDGGRAEPSLACTGTGCQGVPPPPPIFATPSSATFAGVGNFEPQPPAVKPKPRSKTPVRCRRGFHKKHNRCVRSRSRRAKRSAKKSSATGKGR